MTRDEVVKIVRKARKQGRCPALAGANLDGVDLSGATRTKL